MLIINPGSSVSAITYSYFKGPGVAVNTISNNPTKI